MTEVQNRTLKGHSFQALVESETLAAGAQYMGWLLRDGRVVEEPRTFGTAAEAKSWLDWRAFAEESISHAGCDGNCAPWIPSGKPNSVVK